jgi:hypothetical protein
VVEDHRGARRWTGQAASACADLEQRGGEGRGGERKVGPGTQWFVGECGRVHVARLSPEPYPVKCELPSTCLADGSYCSNFCRPVVGRQKLM